MPSDAMKKRAAEAALDYIQVDDVIGVGSGSTVDLFIDALTRIKGKIDACVAASEASAQRLRSHGIPVVDLNHVGELPVCVDGADEATRHLHLIKGGGGALTREKIIAGASRRFVCIADAGKLVDVLGAFALAVEVIPMARSFVARKLVNMGGLPELREGFKTDNGNIILDVRGLNIMEPSRLEAEINHIPGAVTNGIFARRPADVLLVGYEDRVETLS